MAGVSLAELIQLSVTERIQLIEDIWDTIAAHPQDVGLSEAQRNELDRRLADYQQNPKTGATWQEVQQRISWLNEKQFCPTVLLLTLTSVTASLSFADCATRWRCFLNSSAQA